MPTGDVLVPPLPMDRCWENQTIAEWFDIWHSPMASQYTDSDVQGLIKLMVLVDAFWMTENVETRSRLMTEIRLQRQEYGLTPTSRARLHWEVDPVQRVPRPQRPADTGADPRSLLGRQGNVVPLRRGA